MEGRIRSKFLYEVSLFDNDLYWKKKVFLEYEKRM